jgi:S-adenosylmethionine:tRNA ribosyltransferase-isomerase
MSAALATPTTVFPAAADRTATAPPEHRGLTRDGVRLLVATDNTIEHTVFTVLPNHLRPGDVVVINNSATLPAQLDGTWRGGVPVLVHLATDLRNGSWIVELRGAPDAATQVLDAAPGELVRLPGGATLRLLAPHSRERSSPTGIGNRLWRARITRTGPLLPYLHRWGRPIAYGYLRQRFPLEAYQTVFAAEPGSAEMPSAARPFTADLVTALVAGGISVLPITLHTGVSSQDAGEAPQSEWFRVPASTACAVAAARRAGGRVIAVGTTVTRALESATAEDGTIAAASGWTDLVIEPQRGVRIVDGLITGWHDPQASHLLLVEAVAGIGLTQRAYDAAVAEHYLWHEFGDAGLLLRDPARRRST